MNNLENSPSSFIEPDDDVTTSMTHEERMKWMEKNWDAEMEKRFPDEEKSKSSGKSVLDVTFKGEKGEEKPDFGEFTPIKFEARKPGEAEENFEKRLRARERRKMIAAMTYGPEAMFEEDFKTASPDARTSMKNTIETLATADDDEFESDAREAISRIETPFDREGAEGIFDKLSEDRAVLEVIYYATKDEENSWRDMPEAEDENLDIVGQKSLGAVALNSFYKKFSSAADLRNLERELSADPRFRDSDESGSRDRFDLFEDALDRLSETIYGAQEEYMRVAEDLRAEARAAKEKANPVPFVNPVETLAPVTPVENHVEKPSSEEPEKPEEEAIKENPEEQPVKSETKAEEAPAPKPETSTSPVFYPTYSGRSATRRFKTGGYSPMDYGYSGKPVFASNMTGGPSEFSAPFESRFPNGVEMSKSSSSSSAEFSESEEPSAETEEKPLVEELSEEEISRFGKIFSKLKKLGSVWGVMINGSKKNFEPSPALYLDKKLGPVAKISGNLDGKERELMLSKPYKVGDRTALLLYYLETEGAEETAVAKTVIEDSEGDFGIMEKYARLASSEPDAEGRIDWTKTDAEMTAIEDGDLKLTIEKYVKENDPLILEGDPEYYAAGTAKNLNEK